MNNHLLSKARTDEVIGAGTVVNGVVAGSDYKDDSLTKLNVKLDEGVKELTTANNQKKSNDDTKVVNSFEKLRDNAFKAFTSTLRGMKLRADEIVSTNALRIFEIVSRHGLTLYRLADNEQTAKMNSLVDELTKPENMKAMESCTVTELFNEMVASHQEYLDNLAQKEKNDAEGEEIAKVVAARKDTRLALEHLVNYINAVDFINESTALKSLVKSVTSVIDKTNANIHRRNNGDKGSLD